MVGVWPDGKCSRMYVSAAPFHFCCFIRLLQHGWEKNTKATPAPKLSGDNLLYCNGGILQFFHLQRHCEHFWLQKFPHRLLKPTTQNNGRGATKTLSCQQKSATYQCWPIGPILMQISSWLILPPQSPGTYNQTREDSEGWPEKKRPGNCKAPKSHKLPYQPLINVI